MPAGECEGKATEIVNCKVVHLYTNCGPAVTAMMRDGLSCGVSNHSAEYMRTLMNAKAVGVSGCDPTGTDDWKKVLNEHTSSGEWVDGKPLYTAVDHCVTSGLNSNYTAADLAHDMATGAVSVAGVVGRCNGPVDKYGNCTSGQKGPCGWARTGPKGGHALFVAAWNPSTKKFTVYDPDRHKDAKTGKFTHCGSYKSGYFKAEWTETQLKEWSDGYGSKAGALCVLTARGEQKTTPPPPPPPPPTETTDQPGHAVCGATSLHNFYNCGFESTMTNAAANTLYYCNGSDSDGIPVANCLAGCSHSTTDDYCTAPQTTATFMGGSEYNYTLSGDWDPNYFKGTCARGGRGQPHQAMTGLSMDNDVGGAANKVLCEYNDRNSRARAATCVPSTPPMRRSLRS